VRRDRRRRDRVAVIVGRREPHGARLGIVMVAVAGQLDRNAAQVGLVEQMARKLRAGAGQVRPLGAGCRIPNQNVKVQISQ